MAATRMRATDAFTWYMEEDPLLRSTIVAVTLLERAPDWASFVHRMDRASRLSPGFRQRVVSPPMRMGTPRWITDTEIDLGYHIRHMIAPEPRDLSVVVERARTLGMAGFDKARPLWEALLIEGLEDGRAALVLKVHHGLTDGIGGMQLALHLYDLEPDANVPSELPDVPETPELASERDLVLDALGTDLETVTNTAWRLATVGPRMAWSAVRDPVGSARRLSETVGSIARFVRPINDTRSTVMRDRRLSWRYQAIEVSLDDLRRAAKAAGGTVNDAFLASVTGGLRLYHEHHKRAVGDLRLTMPISIRRQDDPKGGNRITLMRFEVPVGIVDPTERINRLHDIALANRQEPAIEFTNTIAGGLNLLPRAYIGGMLKHVDALASNVPGIDAPLFLCGVPVEGLFAFGPTIGSAINTTMLTYNGVAEIGINTDVGAIPDGDVLLAKMREGFQEVLELGGERVYDIDVVVP